MKLSKEQKKFIDQNYLQIPNIDLLTRALFEDDSLDGRNKEGNAIINTKVIPKYKKKLNKIDLKSNI